MDFLERGRRVGPIGLWDSDFAKTLSYDKKRQPGSLLCVNLRGGKHVDLRKFTLNDGS